ncbi:hypothetical protein MHH70_11895 [Metasolibacillus sp. FSL H7-0170]|uniref:hypothetical protein n=1 Tax=Metasolibacillus TaxID=2703677 RepID=UPI000D3C3481|nr:hypothetical protein [Metasolibacillus fluoroglycofenilyticus]
MNAKKYFKSEGDSSSLLIQVKPLADVTDFEGEFLNELEKIWTQLCEGVIDFSKYLVTCVNSE